MTNLLTAASFGFFVGCVFAAYSLHLGLEKCEASHNVERCYVSVTMTGIEVEP